MHQVFCNHGRSHASSVLQSWQELACIKCFASADIRMCNEIAD